MCIKNFRVLVLLMLIAFAVIGISGCGGGGGSFNTIDNGGGGGTTQDYSILDEDYDTDGDGIINILDFDDVERVSYGKDDLIQDKKISIPSRHYLKRLRSIRNEVSFDSFVMDLSAGTEYTVEISKGEYYDSPIGNIIPAVEIINPEGDSLNFLDPETSELSDDVIELSVYPLDNPYMMCFTFTPAETGSYTINLCQSVSPDVVEENVTLFVYEEMRNDDNGEAGYFTRYKFQDKEGNLSATIKMSDIMALVDAYNEALHGLINQEETDISEDQNGELIETVLNVEIDPVNAYLECLRKIKQYYGIFDDYIETQEEAETANLSRVSLSNLEIAADPNSTMIPSEIYGLVYADKFKLGAGFFAITGTKTQNDALEMDEDDLPLPKRRRVKSLYKTTFVSSQEDREKLSSTTVDSSLQLGGFGFSAGYSGESSFKFGLTSTTLVIHYEEVESKYRMLKNSEYKLNGVGQTMLNQKGSKEFRNEFGDYFVGGYKYGGTFDAFIQITTQTTEQLDKVKSHLSASFNSSENAANADVGNKTKDFLMQNNAAVDIQIKTAGIDANGVKTESTKDISRVASALSEFREKLKGTSPENFHPTYVMLKRYRLLTPVFEKMLASNDEGLVPINPAHSTKIMNFNKDLLTMKSYYNVIADLDASTMDSEVKNGYRRRHDNINNTVTTQSNVLFLESNAQTLQNLHNDVLKLNKDLKVIGDRYVFYRMLISAQDDDIKASSTTNINYKPYGYNGGQVGIRHFFVSPAVTSDIDSGNNFHYKIKQFAGKHRYPSFTTTDDEVFCHVQVIAENTHDERRDATTVPAIGTHRMSFHFTCGVARDLEWEVNARSMKFTRDRYPFSGLKQ